MMSRHWKARCRALAVLLLTSGVVTLLGAPPGQAAKRWVVEIDQVSVGAPGNPSNAIVPFTDAIYPSCADAPSGSSNCLTIGSVPYRYQIGELEVTVNQWVKFLNTIDPGGRNRFDLFSQFQKPNAWPQYGQIRRVAKAKAGKHYLIGSEAWADKPYGFADFPSAARFANSLFNGTLLEKSVATEAGFQVTTYRVRLSPNSTKGMYDLTDRRTERLRKRGFVVPSQNEWIKAAYYDPSTESYWKYPTNPGVYGDGSATAPTPTSLEYSTGDVVNQSVQPLASFRQSGLPAPTWCPSYAQVSGGCSTQNPFGLGPDAYTEAYVAGLSSVGQALTRSPWGTLDQGGNAVEWTDTVTPPPAGIAGKRVWRRLHGGVSNAPAYQMWPSAVGLQPEDNIFYDHVYPWIGFRIGVIGNLTVRGGKGPSGAPSYDTSCPEKWNTSTVRGSVFNAVPRPGAYSTDLRLSVPRSSYDCPDWSGVSTPGRAFDGLRIPAGAPQPFRLEVNNPPNHPRWSMDVSVWQGSQRISGSTTFDMRNKYSPWPASRSSVQRTDWGDDWVNYYSFGDPDRVFQDSDAAEVIDTCEKDPRAFGLGVYKGRPSWFFCYS